MIFKNREETNPCSLCAKMRKGAFNEEAKRLAIQTRLEAMIENEYIYDNEMYEESSETIETAPNE